MTATLAAQVLCPLKARYPLQIRHFIVDLIQKNAYFSMFGEGQMPYSVSLCHAPSHSLPELALSFPVLALEYYCFYVSNVFATSILYSHGLGSHMQQNTYGFSC